MNIYLDIIDMDNQENKIKLNLFPDHHRPCYCTFNLKGEFILYSEVDIIDNVEAKRNRKLNFDSSGSDKKIIWIYSTKTNEWFCKGIYKIPDDFELIGMSKYDKFYLRSLRSNHYY